MSDWFGYLGFKILPDEKKYPKFYLNTPKYIFKDLKFYLKPKNITENMKSEFIKNICNSENISKILKYT